MAKMRISLLLMIIVFTLSCNVNDDDIKKDMDDIHQSLIQHDYLTAQNLLSRHSGTGHVDIYEYNAAVIDLFSGDCTNTHAVFDRLLKKYKNSREDLPTQDFIARLHLAISFAELCPNGTDPATAYTLEQSLAHLYQTNEMGIPVKDTILSVIGQWLPPCKDSIPDWQSMASDPGHALDINMVLGQELTICPEGVWLKAQARNHESWSARFNMTPLDRKVWPDDSSKLPFSQLQFDLYDHEPDTQPSIPPTVHFEQPFSHLMPQPSDYTKQTLELSNVEFQKDSIHYIHLYTKDNGEMRLKINYAKEMDCHYIDDLQTYSSDLKPISLTLNPDQTIDGLLLCPSRPDHFIITIEPGQYALITIHENITSSDDKSTPQHIEKSVLDPSGTLLKKNSIPPEGTAQTDQNNHIIFIDNPIHPDQNNGQGMAQEYILIHNDDNQPRQYHPVLQLPQGSGSLQYAISLTLSTKCPNNQKAQTIPLGAITQTSLVQTPPLWVCPSHSITYIPQLPQETPILRAKTEHTFISGMPMRSGDVAFSSFLMEDSQQEELVVEHGKAESDDSRHRFCHSLGKPITPDMRFKSDTQHSIQGFSIVTVTLNEDDESPDDSKESKEESRKQDKKDRHDENQKQDNPNKSPDKPSETKASAKGAGQDAQGNDSTPDEQAEGNKAHRFDKEQFEREQIDDLLDSIENGHYYVPLSGDVENPQSDKDW